MKKIILLIIFLNFSFVYCSNNEDTDTFGSYDVGELFGRCKEDGTCNNGLKCINGFCKPVSDGGSTWGGSISGGNETADTGVNDTGNNNSGNCKEYTCKGCCTSNGFCIEPGTIDNACGKNNSICIDCTASQKICVDGYCTDKNESCSMSNCTGCCGTDQRCHSGFQDDLCGNKGSICIDCTATNQKCINGYCQ